MDKVKEWFRKTPPKNHQELEESTKELNDILEESRAKQFQVPTHLINFDNEPVSATYTESATLTDEERTKFIREEFYKNYFEKVKQYVKLKKI